MLNSFEIGAFVATADAVRAREFYEGVLGLTFVADEQYALIFDANGTRLRIQKVSSVAAIPYTALGWRVTGIETVVSELAGRGVKFEFFEGFGQDEQGIVTFPNGNKVAWFKDPDGNMLSLDQT